VCPRGFSIPAFKAFFEAAVEMSEAAIVGGTTLAVLGIGNRLALAADRVSHYGLAESSARASGTTTKVHRLSDDLMFGSHGMSGLDSPEGVALVDFKTLMAEELKKMQWTQTLATARRFGDRLRARLLEEASIGGRNSQAWEGKGIIEVVVVRRSSAGLEAASVTITVSFQELEGRARILYGSAVVDEMATGGGGETQLFVVTRSDEVHAKLMSALTSKRNLLSNYPELQQFITRPDRRLATEAELRAAASDMVRFTADHDSYIGQEVDSVSLSFSGTS
jgi:hypothetical protein